ncbi:MAG: hypothetical protein PHC61_07185 [Chitinivibrionales bacterium]|nr:hypothetical protein [Chitinivibrionales bacterium]
MKKFDAVLTVREIRDRIYEQNKNKSDDELIAYYQSKLERAKWVQEKRAEYRADGAPTSNKKAISSR